MGPREHGPLDGRTLGDGDDEEQAVFGHGGEVVLGGPGLDKLPQVELASLVHLEEDAQQRRATVSQATQQGQSSGGHKPGAGQHQIETALGRLCCKEFARTRRALR